MTPIGAPYPALAKLIVFSDLDATLREPETYYFEAIKPALASLSRFAIPVILSSSTTVAEIKKRQNEIGLSYPAIVENGSGVYVPEDYEDVGIDEDEINKGAVGYKRIRMYLDILEHDLRQHFRGFGDMGLAAMCNVTGLPRAQAAIARQRRWSEAGLWLGPIDKLTQFKSALGQFGLTVMQGSSFLTISSAPGKQVLVRRILSSFKAADPACPLIAMALGDAPNDIAMLQVVDVGVVISWRDNDQMRNIEDHRCGVIWRSQTPGPEGWNEAVLAVLNLFPRYGPQRET
ncbi:MAG: HAD-IIB family hydrolase [Hyphomicrobiaceae bacterium]